MEALVRMPEALRLCTPCMICRALPAFTHNVGRLRCCNSVRAFTITQAAPTHLDRLIDGRSITCRTPCLMLQRA
jgi:hypothetical protein